MEEEEKEQSKQDIVLEVQDVCQVLTFKTIGD